MLSTCAALFLSTLVAGDIPVHCLRNDFAGVWKLHLGRAIPKGQHSAAVPDFGSEGITKDYCYSGHPNKNSHNVVLDIMQKIPMSDVERTVEVDLSLDVSVNSDLSEHMIARTPDFTSDKEHFWTTTYDEGWEVRMHDGENPVHMFALAKYKCAGDGQCGNDGVGENSDGSTNGYASQCGKTLVGWYSIGSTKGCFWGEKVNTNEAGRVHSFVVEEEKQHHESLLSVRTAYHHQDFEDFLLPDYGSVLQMHAISADDDYDQVRRAGSIKRMKKGKLRVRDECAGDNLAQEATIEELEKKNPIMDWRDYANGTWNTEPLDQGSCGSCYAIAMAYVLEARSNIALHKAYKKAGKTPPTGTFPLKLSSHSVLACSYYNQGCDGGYPYLVAKHAAEFGIPHEDCMPYGSAGNGDVEQCNGKCFKAEDTVVFAKDYNYVGGFYGVCGEARVMKSLLDGPLVVAIEVPAPFNGAGGGKIVGDSYLTGDRQLRVGPDGKLSDSEARTPHEHHRQDPMISAKLLEAKWFLGEGCSSNVKLEDLKSILQENFPANSFVAREGQRFAIDSDNFPGDEGSSPYWESKTTLAKALNVKPTCVHLSMADGTMNGWEYTNHAITVVGWGQQEVDGAMHKYWIIRNSWGAFYGDSGYAYVARGVNYAGIESQAVELTPDLSRGMLAKYIEEIGASPPATLVERSYLEEESPPTFPPVGFPSDE